MDKPASPASTTRSSLHPPPAIGPTGTALADVALPIVNSNAQSEPTTGAITGWTNVTGSLAILDFSTCSAANRCFWGAALNLVVTYQDVAVPVANISEVGGGLRAATVSWRQNSCVDFADSGSVELLFLDRSGATIGTNFPAVEANGGWKQREKTSPNPAGTRTIRARMIMVRNTSGTNNDAYLDDLALKLVANGSASAKPFLAIMNPDAARELKGLGHDARLIPAQRMKAVAGVPPFVPRP
jgi:hypothetical protein